MLSESPTKKLLAESFGTFCLVFAGTGAIIIDQLSSGAISHVGVALTFGLVVLAMIYAVGDISGAHLNPAVTLGFFAAGRMSGRLVIPYMAAQILGALGASLLLRVLFSAAPLLGETIPTGAPAQSFILEVVLTGMLMFVILSVSTGEKERGITAGIVVGAVIALEALFAGPVSGASMNPARSLAPAMVMQNFSHLWLYLLAPPLGALVAVVGCRCIREEKCCRLPSGVTSSS